MTDNESYLNISIENFSKLYRPKSDAYEFDSALHSLMRAAFAEAVRPFAYELRSHRDAVISRGALGGAALVFPEGAKSEQAPPPAKP